MLNENQIITSYYPIKENVSQLIIANPKIVNEGQDLITIFMLIDNQIITSYYPIKENVSQLIIANPKLTQSPALRPGSRQKLASSALRFTCALDLRSAREVAGSLRSPPPPTRFASASCTRSAQDLLRKLLSPRAFIYTLGVRQTRPRGSGVR
jgi:hypothetical protein